MAMDSINFPFKQCLLRNLNEKIARFKKRVPNLCFDSFHVKQKPEKNCADYSKATFLYNQVYIRKSNKLRNNVKNSFSIYVYLYI